jgi:prepilin-type N-terminal cleavage/methylation domain-containing protein
MKRSREMSALGGFTLIELLIVLSVVGVLAAVTLGMLNGARDKARLARAKTEVGQILRAAELVFSEYGYYPNSVRSCARRS